MKDTLLWKYQEDGSREPTEFHHKIHKIFGTYIYPEKIKSKVWWKSQIKFNWTILFNGWIALYGVWIVMKVITYGFYSVPVDRFAAANGWGIALIWFFFWQLNVRSERDHRKRLWKIIELEGQRADEAYEFIRKLEKAVQEEEKKGGATIPPPQQ